MIRRLAPCVLVVTFVAAIVANVVWLPRSAGAAGALPWLKTVGNQIVTESGQPVTLRGANIMRSEWSLTMQWERNAIPNLAHNWKGNILLRGFAARAVADPNFSWTSSWGQTVTHANYMSWLDEEQ